ncbi:hypothetical protein [Nocardia sp. NPDC049707]|uniref:hypothetical protein n=1 Tax=Nocardia sp. NPDC049707 TaxID=3154735 RepID=UPI003417E321
MVFLLAIAGGLIDAGLERRLFAPDAWSQALAHLGNGLRLLISGVRSRLNANSAVLFRFS